MGKKFQIELKSKTWQQQIINDATYTGRLDDLCWSVELREEDGEVGIANYPLGFIPFVSLSPDPRVAAEWAHLLLELFRSTLPACVFALSLCSKSAFPSMPVVWYEWGDRVLIDKVCSDCGSVERVNLYMVEAGVNWICDCCVRSEAWSVIKKKGAWI